MKTVEIKDILAKIEDFAPPQTAEEWDNSGWQINLHLKETKKILACLTVTDDVLEHAIAMGCDLIISHHPLIFSPLKKLTNPLHQRAIQNNVQIYSAHTNFDRAKGGTTDILVEKLGLLNVKAVNDYVKSGELPFELTLEKFISTLKTTYALEKIKVINKLAKNSVKTVAICAGAGAEFIGDVCGADVYITSDVKYHAALEVKNMALLDIGHFESEKFFSEKIVEILKNEPVEVITANEKPAWTIV